MLATVAALQLLVLSQITTAPREVRPEDATADDVAAAAQAPAPPAEEPAPAPESAPAENPPLPSKPQKAEPPLPERPAAVTPAKPSPPRQLSLLSGEPLRGGSASLAWLGWSSLGIMYGQGITQRDDLAGYADFDWAKTELRLGALYRRPLGMAGAFDMAGRLSLAWYQNFGSDYIYSENHSDHGIELVPGLSLSARAANGIFSILVEAPLTVTMKYSSGLLFSPRASAAYETLLYQDVTVGALVGLGYRAGSGDAPLSEGRGELRFLLVAGYQLL